MLKDDAWMISPRGKVNMTPSSQIILMDENTVTNCPGCDKKFNVIIKKHHCRSCGHVFCGQCSTKKTLLKGARKVKQRICEECTDFFQAQQLLVPVNTVETINDDDDALGDNENTVVPNVDIVSNSPKRTPLRDISPRDSYVNIETPVTVTKNVGIMSHLKSGLKMQSTTTKPTIDMNEEKIDLNSWTHSHTPPMNSPFVLSPNLSGITPKTTIQQPISTEEKVNRIATPESMIGSPVAFSPESTDVYTDGSPVAFSPENTNVYTDVVEVRPTLHIDTFRVMLISLVIVILASTSMINTQNCFHIRSKSTDPSRMEYGHYIISQAEDIEEIKYDLPTAYTGDFSLSDPVHNRNQVHLFMSNISKMFRSFFDQIFGIQAVLTDAMNNLKNKMTEKLIREMRGFTRVV